MRALSLRQAASCESALHRHCMCRCGGVYHSLRHSGNQPKLDRSFFESLPEHHPHRLPTEDEIRERRRLKREQAPVDAAEAERAAGRERFRTWNELVTGVRR